MARIEFTVAQEKAIIKYLSKRYVNRRCTTCKHVNGCFFPYSKTCQTCYDKCNWKPDKHVENILKDMVETIKQNK